MISMQFMNELIESSILWYLELALILLAFPSPPSNPARSVYRCEFNEESCFYFCARDLKEYNILKKIKWCISKMCWTVANGDKLVRWVILFELMKSFKAKIIKLSSILNIFMPCIICEKKKIVILKLLLFWFL